MDALKGPPSGTVETLLNADTQAAAELVHDAVAGYESALLETDPSDIEAYVGVCLRLADCYQKISQCDRVLSLLEPILHVSLTPEWRARVLTRLGWARLYLGDGQACIRDCSEAVVVLNPTVLHEDLARAARRLGYALKWQGRLVDAEDAFRDALAASKRGDDREQVGFCLHALGNLCRHRGQYHQAVVFHELSLAIDLELGARALVAKDLCSIGLATLYSGDWTRALEALERASRLSTELNLERGMLLVDLTLARLHRRRGESTTALDLARRALRRAEETGDARAIVLSREELGDLAWCAGDLHAAAAEYDLAWQRALAIAPEGDLVYELAWRRSQVLLEAGLADDADALAQQAYELAERNGDSRESCNALRVLSRVKQRQGSPDESAALLERALGLARTIEAPYEIAEVHEACASLPVPTSAALAHLFEARRLYTQLGARPGVDRVEEQIDHLEGLIVSEGDVLPRETESPAGMIVRDAGMKQVTARATELASTDTTVLLQGPTGTGKEVLARLIHEGGPRATQPFVAVNCAALPTHLLESELFGHRRGSFTGAEQDRVGLFEAARQGTVFLDEIDKASPEFQNKLLRVIEDRRVRPVGSSQEVEIAARVLCATNRDLRDLMESGRFLPDLYYRLAAFRLVVPNLRERPDDLWALVDHFLALSRVRFGGRRYRLTKEARTAIATYEWPGNVRELKNVLEAAAFFCRRSGVIGRNDLPAELMGTKGATSTSLPERIETLERREIALALRRAHGVKALAAQMLGVSRKGLLDRLRRLGIQE